MFNEDGLLNKIVTAAIIGLLGWLILTTQDMSIKTAVVAEQVLSMKELIISMQSIYITKDAYETRRHMIDAELDRIRERLDILEGRNAGPQN